MLSSANNACNGLEDRLQKSIPVFDEKEDVWMNVLPAYRRSGSEEYRPSCAQFRDTQAEMLPLACHGPYNYIKPLAFLDLMTPEFAVVLRGRNKMSAVHLNSCYMIISAICNLSIAMTHGNVQTQILPGFHD